MSEPGSLIRTLSGRPAARNFHSYVINEVGRAIVSGDMPVGSSLPGDAEMMDRFGVSRTVLREALKTLEAKGLVEARAKVGTRVLPQSRWNLFDRQILAWKLESGPSPAFLASFQTIRESLEVQAARLAARLREADVVIIAVPTPVTRAKDPDLGPVAAAAVTIGRNLKPGAVVVLESTVYPGVTEELMAPVPTKVKAMWS